MRYHHITREERVKIEAWLQDEHSLRDIAGRLRRNVSNISRELHRNHMSNTPELYRGSFAEKRRKRVRKEANQHRHKVSRQPTLQKYVEEKLRKYWSPEQIAGRWNRRHQSRRTRIVHETIYQYIYQERKELRKYLRCQKGKYRRKRGTKLRERTREDQKKKRIDLRPKVVEKRTRTGDWEGDTIIGQEKTRRILTHTERRTGYLLADKLSVVTAEEVARQITRRFQKIPRKKRHTITYDNGAEFSLHELIERDVKIPVYFSYPYHSWERGTSENTNGLLRQFFPKKTLFAPITKQKLDRVVKLINTRPRKRLNFQTPEEMFRGKCCRLT